MYYNTRSPVSLPAAPFMDAGARKDLLKDSAFVPGGGGLWHVFPRLAGAARCVVVADYGVDYESYHTRAGELEREWDARRYRAMPEELLTSGWQPPAVRPEDKFVQRIIGRMKGGPFPFYEWILGSLQPDARSNGAAQLLYLADEALWTYHGLYVAREIHPRFLVLPPHGGGTLTWTSLHDPSGEFARTVLENPAGQPEFLLQFTPEPLWPDYTTPAELPDLPRDCGLFAFKRAEPGKRKARPVGKKR